MPSKILDILSQNNSKWLLKLMSMIMRVSWKMLSGVLQEKEIYINY